MQEQILIQKKLNEVMISAKLKNPSYSLRAFARKLDMSPSAVSEILNGKRRISRKLAEKITQRLCLDPEESRAILECFPQSGSDGNSPQDRNGAASGRHARRYLRVPMDQFHLISEWHHFAILSLAETEDFRSDPAWIARRLNIGIQETRAALERLERLGMLKRAPDGGLRPSGANYETPDDIANLALRKAHAQNLELARASLEKHDVTQRDFSSITMCVDRRKLPAAKKMIRKFQDRLCAFMESGSKNEVFKLCVQLIPLTETKGGQS